MTKRKKNKNITDSAKGEDCQVRIPGVCNFNPETTVPAHLNGGGMGTKHNDMFIAYACSNCHNCIDKNNNSDFTDLQIKLWHHEGMVRTQYILLEKELIKA